MAKAARSPLWFQLYVNKDRGFTRDLVQRAEAAGCAALCVTVDSPLTGMRHRERRAGFALPPGLERSNLKALGAATAGATHRPESTIYSAVLDPALTWKDIEWLRGISRVPLILKGVLSPEDASTAADSGSGHHRVEPRRQEPRHRAGDHRRLAAGRGRGGRTRADSDGRRGPARHRRAEGAGVGRLGGPHRPAVPVRPRRPGRRRGRQRRADPAPRIRDVDGADRPAVAEGDRSSGAVALEARPSASPAEFRLATTQTSPPDRLR